MLPPSIQNLINQFTKLPSVGPRQATRFVFYLLKKPDEEIKQFAKALYYLKNINQCSWCYRFIETTNKSSNLCSICQGEKRDKSIICIIEKDSDLEAIERTKRYNGIYHILGTDQAEFLDENFKKASHLNELITRIKKDKNIKEVIIATSATTDGDTLALYIARILKPLDIKITRLGRGLSTGSELEYMDEETLSQALIGRK